MENTNLRTKMADNISFDSIKELLGAVKHPVINNTLLDLGIINDIRIKDNEVTVVLAFPFENIPIKDQLISLVKEPLSKLALEAKIETIVMNQEDLQKFLAKEQEY